MVGMTNMEEKEVLTPEELTIYELGYLIMPIITEENVGAEEGKVKDVVEKSGTIISSKTPEMTELAYDITKKIGGKNQHFHSAYLGSLIFRLPQGEIEDLKKELDKNESLLRHLITKRSKESLIAPQARMPRGKTADKKEKPSQGVNEQEIESAIEELVAE